MREIANARIITGNEIRRRDTIISKDGHQGLVQTICTDDEKDCDTAGVGFRDGHIVEYLASDIAILLDRPTATTRASVLASRWDRYTHVSV